MRLAFPVLLLSALVAAPVCPVAADAAPTTVRSENKGKKSFVIAANEAAASLELFAEQAGTPVIYLVEQVRGVKTNAVKGEFTPRDALNRLVANTGLTVTQDAKSGALVIRSTEGREPPAVPPQSNPKSQTAEEPAKPMNRKNILAMLGAWLAVAFAPAHAQTSITPQSPNANQKEEETIVLSPFQVNASEDAGYRATNTLDGSRLNTALRDTPAAIGVFTKDFLDDIGATDIESILRYDLSSEIVGDTSDHRATGNGEGSGSIENGAVWRTRGLGGTLSTNGFRTGGDLADTYNVERADLSRGPNAILFGTAAGGGVLNLRTKRANVIRDANSVELKIGEFDTHRASLDLNRALIKKKLAMRVMGLVSHQEEQRPHVYTDKKALTIAAQYRPAQATSIDVSFDRNLTSGVGTQPFGPVDNVTKFLDALKSGDVVWNQARERYETLNGAVVGALSGVGNINQRTVLVYGPAGPNERPVLWEGASLAAGRTTLATNAIRYAGETFAHTDEGITPYNRVSAQGASTYTVAALSNFTATFNHRWFDNLHMELAYNRATRHTDAAFNNAAPFLAADLDYRLPDGTLNPYFYGNGYYFIYTPQGFRHTRANDNDTLRASFSYDLDLGKRWGRHRFAVMADRHKNHLVRLRFREQWAGAPFGGNPEVNNNHVYRRRYFKIDGPWENYTTGYSLNPHASETYQSANAGTLTTAWVGQQANALFEEETTTDSGLFVMQSYLLNQRLVTTVGLRFDRIDSAQPNMIRDPMTRIWRIATPGDAGYQLTEVSQSGYRRSLGAVFHVNSNFSLTANTATGVELPGSSQVILPFDRNPDPYRTRGVDYGIGFSFLENRISGSAKYYESRSNNEVTNSRVQAIYVNPNSDVLRSFAHYFEQAGVTSFGSSDPIRSLDELTSAPLVSLADGYLSDNASTGYELELMANPTPNWAIRFGYSYTKRTRQNVLNEGEGWWADRLTLFKSLDALYMTRTGRPSVLNQRFISQAGVEGNTTIAERIAFSDSELAFVRNIEGQGYGNRPFKANIWTRYTFTDGPLRGVAVGGGIRYQDKNIAGFDQPTNVESPEYELLYGNSSLLVDLMVQYKTKGFFGLFPKAVGVTYRLNVANLLDNRDIIITSLRYRSGSSATSGASFVGAGSEKPYLRRAWRQHPRRADLGIRLDF